MTWPMRPTEGCWPRHRLVRLAPTAWAALLASRADLADEPLLDGWADRGWPLIVRRCTPGEVSTMASDVPVGLPLPPSAGKRRIALQVQADDIVSVEGLPQLGEVIDSAPPAWRTTLHRLTVVGDRFGVQTQVFGSLAWQWLTGLAYVSEHSDVDLVWTLPRRAMLDDFLAALADIDAVAPMRVDGELLRADGAGANWRELNCASADVLVKTAAESLLCGREHFLEACA